MMGRKVRYGPDADNPVYPVEDEPRRVRLPPRGHEPEEREVSDELTPTRLAEIEAAHGKAPPRISMDRVSELQAECNNRHMLDPLWNQLANALGAQWFDLVDARNDIGELAAALREAWAETANLMNIAAAAASAATEMSEQRDLANQRAVAAKAAIERLRRLGDAMADELTVWTNDAMQMCHCCNHKAPINETIQHDSMCPVAAWNAAKGGK